MSKKDLSKEQIRDIIRMKAECNNTQQNETIGRIAYNQIKRFFVGMLYF